MSIANKFPKNKAQIFDNPFQSVICEVYNCRNRAKYFIGKPEGPNSVLLNVCEKCMKEIAESLGINYPELLPAKEVEVEKKCVCAECKKEFEPTDCYCDECLAKDEEIEKEIYQDNESELVEFIRPEGSDPITTKLEQEDVSYCQYCGKECKPKGLAAHERNCPKNPGTKDEQK